MNKQTKRTAANTPFLADCKKLFNKPIYAKMTEIMNQPGSVENCVSLAKAQLAAWHMPTDPAAVLTKLS